MATQSALYKAPFGPGGASEITVPLAEKLLDVPVDLIRTALDLELGEGTVIADRVGETPCVFLAGLHRAERVIAVRLMRLATSTGLHTADLAARAAGRTIGYRPPALLDQPGMREAITTTTPGEKIGGAIEQLGEFFVPIPGLNKLRFARNAPTILRMGAGALREGLDIGLKTAAQTGSPEEALRGAETGAIFGAAGPLLDWPVSKVGQAFRRSAEKEYAQVLAPGTKADKYVTAKKLLTPAGQDLLDRQPREDRLVPLASALGQEPCQGRAAGQAAVPPGEGQVDGLPGFAGGARNGARPGAGPTPRPRVVGVGPGEDLFHGQGQAVDGHGVDSPWGERVRSY